jgi:uncharacterized protein (UPF0218 family)
MIISERMKAWLRNPFGTLCSGPEELLRLAAGRRLVAVGDACTLALLRAGTRPHLAVFDFRSMRHEISPDDAARLRSEYPRPAAYENPPGTLSEKMISDAPMLLEKGGGVLIAGEEDLTALAFVLAAGRDDAIVYGQPGKGMVLVLPGAELKKRITAMLSLPAE